MVGPRCENDGAAPVKRSGRFGVQDLGDAGLVDRRDGHGLQSQEQIIAAIERDAGRTSVRSGHLEAH